MTNYQYITTNRGFFSQKPSRLADHNHQHISSLEAM